MSSRWLKPLGEDKPHNVSQSDVRRMAQEKAAKQSPPPPLGGVTPPNATLRDNAKDVAPSRDFNKRANSLDRLALPAGLFPGSSKKLYDALYIRTRGAVVPTKTIRATRRELIEWSGIRNIKTIDSHLRYLTAIGLLVHHWERGQNDGSLYEVQLPEETTGLAVRNSTVVAPPNPTLGVVTPPKGTLDQNLDIPLDQNLGLGGVSQTIDIAVDRVEAKTSYKTKEENTDDEAFADFITLFKKATLKVTGKEVSTGDRARWKEVAEVLTTELEIAAARTTVSSAPAFLAEHLRRRLWKKDKAELAAESRQQQAGEAPEQQQVVNANQCADCGGTGFYYPNGYDGGVAKCKHQKLSK